MKKIIQGLRQKPILRYTLPFIVFMLLTEVQRFGTGQTIFWIYGIKTLLTLGLLFLCFGRNQEDVAGNFDMRAILLGLAVFVIWIFLGHWTLKKPEISFNPEVFAPGMLRVTAIGVRILGACLVVPIMEELLWRSFLMRYLIQQKFLEVPLGKYTHLSFWGTVAAFALVHHSWEWPAAVFTGICYGFYLIQTKNLRGCIWAHATTNAALAVYVIITRQWFWW